MRCKLQLVESKSFYFVSKVYGMNSAIERRRLWHDLHLCSFSAIWCILGDFNAVRSVSKSKGGDNSWDNGMEEFNDCLDSLGTEDIRAIGPHHI